MLYPWSKFESKKQHQLVFWTWFFCALGIGATLALLGKVMGFNAIKIVYFTTPIMVALLIADLLNRRKRKLRARLDSADHVQY